MFKTITAALLAVLCTVGTYANDYEEAWVALTKRNYKEAENLLQKAKQNSNTSLDAYLTQVILQNYQGKQKYLEGFLEKLSESQDKNAYLYSLWFNEAALGVYGKKTSSHQLKFLQKIFSDNTFNGSIQSAAHYVKAMHHVFANEYSKAKNDWGLMGALENWQLVGPFENLSGSGFNSQFAPILASTDVNTKFKGSNDIEVNWFTPAKMNNEGWVFTYGHIKQYSAIVYAQTFVYAPEDMKVLLNAGCNGSLKVWVNDGLIISEAKERVTELDYYKNYCNLKKGYNRILVQLGYTDNSTPNYIIRLTDEALNSIKDIKSTSQVQTYSKTATVNENPISIKHFAEEFFESKIAAEPKNLVNYILLSQTYLRNNRSTESRQIIEKALKIAPDNILLKFELLQNLVKAGNRTVLLQELEWLKEKDPESYINYEIKVDELIEEEKYTEAEEELVKMIEKYGENETTIKTKINLLAKMQKVEELLAAVEKAYAQYPENTDFLGMMFRVKRDVLKNSKAALNIYEKYLKNNFSYNVTKQLAAEYDNMGLNDKYFDIVKSLYDKSSYDPSFASDMSSYYYKKKNLSKALQYAQEALQLAPYTGTYWYNVGAIQEELKDTEEAIKSYKKTIYYDRTNYDARKKLNQLQQKTDLYKLLPQAEVYDIIKKASAGSDYDFEYLMDEKATIIYDQGASEEYVTYVVKIYTDKGIDSWKEFYIPYSSSTQSLLIEKAEAVKVNGSKVPAERNGGDLVFTGLEKGDAIYVKYRLQNYTFGRLGKEFWDKFIFNSFVPAVSAKYTLIVPKNFQFNSQVINNKIEVVKKQVDDVDVYTWEIKNIAPLKTEPVMPPLNDVGTVLHISTIKTWADVADWYSDISYQNNTNNYELNSLYNEIFEGTKSLSKFEKAKKIYEYIVTNIRYSSVSFRQSGLVPQNISKIITTKLGDCKDLSSLFVALADKAGLQAQLVLVDTRDNGKKDMILPSMEFNHCIALLKLEGKDYYIELTDSDLPFTSLPYNLNGALSLVIPVHGQKSTATKVIPLVAVNRSKDQMVKQINVTVSGKDLKFNVKAKKYGSLTSAWRNDYATLSADKQKEEFEQFVGNNYKNPVKLESVAFTGMNELSDSLVIDYNYSVKNEVIEAGSMKMIKVPFLDIIASLESFAADKREFPIEYWNYENTDFYETVITIKLEPAQKILEIPANQSFTFNNSSYSIKYLKEGETLKIYRQAKLNREDIQPAEYEKFKKFFNDIVEAETKYVVFK